MDEVIASDVIARIEAVEIEPHAVQLFGAIGFKWLLRLIGFTLPPLVGKSHIEAWIPAKRTNLPS